MKRSLHPYPGAVRAVTCKNGTIHASQGYPLFTLSGITAHAIRAKLDATENVICGPHVILLYGKPTEYFDEELNKYSVFEEPQKR